MNYPRMTIGSICTWVKGKKPTQLFDDISKNLIPYLSASYCRNNKPDYYAHIDDKNLIAANKNDVLLIWDGSNAGDVFIGVSGALSSTMVKFNESDKCVSKYLYYLLKNNFKKLNQETMGSAIPHVNGNILKNIEFFLPPLIEQKKLIKKIDALFAEIDAGLEIINELKKQLELYKQAVLNAAIRGQLIPQVSSDESASVLLEKIKAEKETLIKAGKLKRAKPLPPIDANNMPFELPKGWQWARLGEIAIASTYGSSTKTCNDLKEIPVLGMGNIQNGKIDYSKLKYLPKTHNEFPELLLKQGDLLFNRTNSAELVGKCAIFKSVDDSVSFASYLIRLRFPKKIVEPEFIAAIINSSYGRSWIRSVMVQQVGQANVNGSKLAQLMVPFPPFKEQQEIVYIMQKSLFFVNKSLEEINKLNQMTMLLKQSVLKQAFEGNLV